jgi:hypothetical protein
MIFQVTSYPNICLSTVFFPKLLNLIASTSKMSGQSSVGNSQVYEAGDQKNVPQSEIQQAKKDNRFHEGRENSHKANDSSKNELCFLKCERTLIVTQRTRDPSPISWHERRRSVIRQLF